MEPFGTMAEQQATVAKRRRASRTSVVALLLGLSCCFAGVTFSLLRPTSSSEVGFQGVVARRRQLIGGMGIVAASPELPALAFETYKDSNGLWEFKYPTGLQKSESKTYNGVFLRDIIEPLESVGLRIIPTNRKSLDEIGDVNEVAKKLLADVVPKGAPQEVIKAESKIDREGRRQDIIEYRYQWRFDKDMAARLGRNKFQLHCKAIVMIEQKKQYLLLEAVEEPRWEMVGDMLGLALETFKLTA